MHGWPRNLLNCMKGRISCRSNSFLALANCLNLSPSINVIAIMTIIRGLGRTGRGGSASSSTVSVAVDGRPTSAVARHPRRRSGHRSSTWTLINLMPQPSYRDWPAEMENEIWEWRERETAD